MRRYATRLLAFGLLVSGFCFSVAAQTPLDPPGGQTATPPQTGPTAPPAPGDPNAQRKPSGGSLRQTEFIVVGDGYVEYNANGTPLALRNFDTRQSQMSVSMLKLAASKTPTADERFGFRVDVQFGPATTIIHAAEPSNSTVLRHVEQAFASYLAPLGKGLQIDFGEFVTQHGAEVIEAKDNWNYSRSLMFALAIPYYHMGLRATYAVNDKVSVMGAVVNGWNDVVDNNRGKTYGAQVALKPTAKLSIVQNYMAGPEQPQETRDWRQLSDTVVTYALTPALSVMANYDYGRDTIGQVPLDWQGVAGYARYQITRRFAVSPRVEWYEDASGFTSGTPQTLREATATAEMKLVRAFLWRAELRHDSAAAPFFRTSARDLVKGQTTFGVGVLYAFSSK